MGRVRVAHRAYMRGRLLRVGLLVAIVGGPVLGNQQGWAGPGLGAMALEGVARAKDLVTGWLGRGTPDEPDMDTGSVVPATAPPLPPPREPGRGAPPPQQAVAPAAPALKLDPQAACLARAIYHETAHDPPDTRAAIGRVALNRVAAARTSVTPSTGGADGKSGPPKTVCGIVYHGRNLPLGCLFVATCRSVGAAEPTGPAWIEAQHLARDLMQGRLDPTERFPALAQATHFHLSGERPGWAGGVTPLVKVGRFHFLGRKEVEQAAVSPKAAVETATATPVAAGAVIPTQADGEEESKPAPKPRTTARSSSDPGAGKPSGSPKVAADASAVMQGGQ